MTQPIVLVLCTLVSAGADAWAEPSQTPRPNHITSRISRQPVQSSAIAKVGYSKRGHILEIEFVNGAVYSYFDVPVVVLSRPHVIAIKGGLVRLQCKATL